MQYRYIVTEVDIFTNVSIHSAQYKYVLKIYLGPSCNDYCLIKFELHNLFVHSMIYHE